MAEEIPFDCAFAKAVRGFTRSSYAETIKNNLQATDNVFYSPLSIVMALAALHVGAKANTARQIEHVLGISESEAKKLPGEIAQFLETLKGEHTLEDGTVEKFSPLHVANALAVQKDYAVEHAFLETLQTGFNTELSRVDFEHDVEAARHTINSWVAKHTADRIPELFSRNSIDATTRLVIANAVQFDAGWDKEFDETATQNATFSLLAKAPHSNATVPVRMMTRETTKFIYWSNDPIPDWPDAPTPYSDVVRVGILSLPYKRVGYEVIEMLIVLPHDRDGLSRLEELIAREPDALDNLLDAFHNGSRRRDVNIRLPSFKFEEDFQLADTLKRLGATDMFEARIADFGGISEAHGRSLCVGSAVHRAVIDVDEKGTRAAAATGFSIMLMCAPIPEVPVDFVVDHPCLFMLRATSPRVPLFIGRLAQPKRE